MFSALASLLTFLGSIGPSIAQGYAAKQDGETRQVISMSETERAEVVANQQAQTAANTARTVHGTLVVSQILTFLFGFPAALHWGWTFFTATFPGLGFATDPLHGQYAQAEHDIAMSFFILTPTLPIVQAISARLSK
jgi:hypothetical protein